jgi:hypothetical protein
MALMTLGTLQLDGFEVPANVRFGGAQKAIIHNLIGGARIIDTMGRDDCALTWHGVLSGSDAGDRARTLDAMRVSGAALALAWDAFCYDVIIGQLEFDFCNPWWITYRIECLVVSDLAQSSTALTLDLASSVLGDLSLASSYVNVSSIVTTLSTPSALTIGASGIPLVLSDLSAVLTAITSDIGTAEQGLDSQDLSELVSSSGTLAQLATAQGYVGRTITNLEGILV